MTRRLLFGAILSAVLSAGCFEMFRQSTTNPTPTVQLLGGTWQSVTPTSTSLVNSCANFKWTATEQSSTVSAGTFSATCFGTLQVTGTARATFSGTSIAWTASGTSTGGGLGDCPITLSGSAIFETDQIRIPYSGMTCLGAVSGTEILKRA